MTKPTNRRFPAVLADKLLGAFRQLDALGISGERQVDLLLLKRRDTVRAIAAGSIDKYATSKYKGDRSETPRSELLAAIADKSFADQAQIQQALIELDHAFEAVHRYREPGGVDDYLSASVRARVVSIKNSEARSAKQPGISSVRNHEEIAAYLRKRGFASIEHGQIGVAVTAAAGAFFVSESSIYRVIRHYKLKAK